MIRYRRLYESENSDIKLYDVVRCAGYEWYVIDIEGDIVTLLAKNRDFGSCRFDKKSIDYETSEIRKYLNSNILPKLRNVNPIPTDLPDEECMDKVWLLSKREADILPKKIRRFVGWWWLRSYGRLSNFAAGVFNDGDIDSEGSIVTYDPGSVRPAMRVHIDDLEG